MNALTKTTEPRRQTRKNQNKNTPKDIPLSFEPTKNLVSNAMLMTVSGIAPEVGMGATLCYHSDRHAATITEVKEEKNVSFITVQEDISQRIDRNGPSFDQQYEYSRNPNGRIYTYRYRNGRWVGAMLNENGRWVTARHFPALIIGIRDQFFDFTKS